MSRIVRQLFPAGFRKMSGAGQLLVGIVYGTYAACLLAYPIWVLTK